MRIIFIAAYVFLVTAAPVSNAIQTRPSLCDRILLIDGDLMSEVLRGTQPQLVMSKRFPMVNREFLVFQYKWGGWVAPPVPKSRRPKAPHSGQFRLRFVLLDTKNKSVVWQFDEFSLHAPSVFELSPVNPNVGYVGKQIQRLYLPDNAPSTAIYDQEYRANRLSSDLAMEVLEVTPEDGAGKARTRDLFTTQNRIIGLKISEDGHKLTVNMFGEEQTVDLSTSPPPRFIAP